MTDLAKTAILASLLLFLEVPSAVAMDEAALRGVIVQKCSGLFVSRDFSGLSIEIDNYQNRDVRTPSGAWTIEVCMGQILSKLGNEKKDANAPFWDSYQTSLETYIAGHPDDRNLPIVYATLLRSHGWAYRGTSFASDVPPAQWAPFHEFIEKARKALDDSRTVSKSNPMWYAYRFQVQRDGKRDPVDLSALLADATARFPGFTPIYFAASDVLDPKWGGSFEGIEKLATLAAKRAAATEGESMYARVYYHAAGGPPCCGREKIFAEPWFDRAKLSRAIEDLVRRYPDQWNFNIYAQLSCIANSPIETAKLISLIEPQPAYLAWGKTEENAATHFDYCKKWALMSAPSNR